LKKSGDQHFIKQINRSLVLDTIIAHAPLSRSDIASFTGLNKATVSSLVNEWMEEQLVFETGLGTSSGGRKPVMLLFHREAGCSIGVDLGVNYVSALLTDLNGQVISRELRRLTETEPKNVAEQIVQTVRYLIDQAPNAPYGVIGVGVGVPGIVNGNGVVLTAPNLGWNGVPLRDMLEAELGIPVTIDNEANAGAAGEKQYGTGKDADSLVYISAGIGIGTGFILHNEVYRGASGLSGELGHMTIQADGGLSCSCGSTGCWEMYASEKALLRRTGRTQEYEQLEDVLRLASAGDAEAIAALADIGRYLGIGLASIMNAYNPDLIIIGNRLALAKPWLEHKIADSASRCSLRHHRECARVEFTTLGLDSTALGAASFAIQAFLHRKKTGDSRFR